MNVTSLAVGEDRKRGTEMKTIKDIIGLVRKSCYDIPDEFCLTN